MVIILTEEQVREICTDAAERQLRAGFRIDDAWRALVAERHMPDITPVTPLSRRFAKKKVA